jgi:hypothetical protein
MVDTSTTAPGVIRIVRQVTKLDAARKFCGNKSISFALIFRENFMFQENISVSWSGILRQYRLASTRT